jgi:hypothetical protein
MNAPTHNPTTTDRTSHATTSFIRLPLTHFLFTQIIASMNTHTASVEKKISPLSQIAVTLSTRTPALRGERVRRA